MILDAVVVSTKPPLAMAATSSLQASLSLEILPNADEGGRPMLRRQGSLTPGSSSPKVDWRGGQSRTIRRAQSVGSALSEFLGSSRKSFEESSSSSMQRSGSRGCLDSLEASSNARDDGSEHCFEEDREWNFANNTLRPGGMLHRDTFPSPPFLSQEWQSFGKGNKDSFRSGRPQLKRTASAGHKMAIPKKSIVMEQAQESFDSLKDRLESSLRMQPECSCAPPSPMAPNVMLPDAGVLGLAKDVSALKLSTLPRSLKRRKNKERGSRGSCAMSNAFSALVFIIKSMHGHALEMQEEHHVMKLQQRDMDLSFAWLFQQVFATTPEYMLSIMVLLADFTVHSLGADMALAAASAMVNPQSSSRRVAALVAKEGVAAGLRKELNRRNNRAAAKHEEIPQGIASSSSVVTRIASSSDSKISDAEERVMNALMAEAMKEMESNAGWQPLHVVEKEVANKLVAPVQVTISPDNYTCFDRTDLEYQHAISSQPTNVMLLSNYAQFLYVVRHDNNRYKLPPTTSTYFLLACLGLQGFLPVSSIF